jgi:hypothetical protein
VLREEQRIGGGGVENTRGFSPNKDAVTENCNIWRDEKLKDFYCSPDVIHMME